MWTSPNIDIRHVTVFCRFLRRNCAEVAKIVSSLHAVFFFFVRDQSRGDGPILPAQAANQETGFASYFPRALPAI